MEPQLPTFVSTSAAAPSWSLILEDVAHPAALVDASGELLRANRPFALACGLSLGAVGQLHGQSQSQTLRAALPRLWQVLEPLFEAAALAPADGRPLTLVLPSDVLPTILNAQATLRAVEGAGPGSEDFRRLLWLSLRPSATLPPAVDVPAVEAPPEALPDPFVSTAGDRGTAEATAPAAEASATDGSADSALDGSADSAAQLRARFEESERRYLFLSESIPQIVWVASPDSSISYLNGRGLEYFGVGLGTMDGSLWASLVHPDDAPLAQEKWLEAIVSRQPFEVRYRLRRADGCYLWFLGLALPLLDPAGQVRQWLGTCTDIDASMRLEGSLRLLADAGDILTSSLEEAEPLQQLAQRLVAGFATWCLFERVLPGGRFETLALAHADPGKLAALHEMQRHATENRATENRVTPDRERLERPQMRPLISEEALGEIALDGTHLKYLQQAGVSSLISVPLLTRGTVLGVITLARAGGQPYEPEDLSLAEEVASRAAGSLDSAALYRQAQAALSAAQEAGHAKDEFLATVSHELRTPLTAILGWANLLKSGRVDPETTRSALETIERNVRAQAQIVEDLLDVSRIVAGNLRLEMRPVELAPIVSAAIEAVRPAMDAKSIVLRFEAPAPRALPLVVSGDPMRLQQVVWNLLSNAVKFTPHGGRIEVSLSLADSQVSLTVRDSGPGVPPGFAPHLFERFRQADSSSTRRHGGLGLGLAIVRHLAEMHGGHVRLEPHTGSEGATFVVSLPFLAVEGRVEVEKPTGPDDFARLMLQGRSVLVVEDEADSRELLNIVLSRFGARVRLAPDAGVAWQLLQEEKPDVLVSDIGLPGEDGYSLIRRVRSLFDPAQLPAIALTAYAAASDRERALEAGFNAHVTKPATPIQLAMTVAGLLEPHGSPSST